MQPPAPVLELDAVLLVELPFVLDAVALLLLLPPVLLVVPPLPLAEPTVTALLALPPPAPKPALSRKHPPGAAAIHPPNAATRTQALNAERHRAAALPREAIGPEYHRFTRERKGDDLSPRRLAQRLVG